MCVFMIFYYIIQGGGSFLHSCARNGHTYIINFLIYKGANTNVVDVVSVVFHYSCVKSVNIYTIQQDIFESKIYNNVANLLAFAKI